MAFLNATHREPFIDVAARRNECGAADRPCHQKIVTQQNHIDALNLAATCANERERPLVYKLAEGVAVKGDVWLGRQ